MIYGSGNLVITRPIDSNDNVHIYDQHSHKVTVARFQPKFAGTVASGDAGGNVRVWALNEINTLKQERKDLSNGVNDLCYTGDGKRLLVVGSGKQQYGVAFLLDTGTTVGNLSQHSKDALSVDCRPERPFKAVTTGEDYEVCFYKGPPYKFDKSLPGHEKFVNCARYSPDGSMLCTVGSDRKGLLFQGKEGEFIGELDQDDGHKGSIFGCTWSPDGKKILTVSADKTAKLWDAESRKCEQTFAFASESSNIMLGAAWTTEGPVCVGLNGDIHILDPEHPEKPKRTIYGHQKMPTSMVYDSNTNTAFTSAYDGVLSWEVGVGSKARITSEVVTGMAVSGDSLVVVNQDREVRYLSIESPDYKNTEPAFTLNAGCLSVDVCSSDSSLLVFTTSKGVSIVRNKELVKEFPFHFKAEIAALSTDGSQLAVGTKNNQVHLFDFDGSTLTKNTVIEGHEKKITTLSFSQDGKYLASGDYGHEIRVTDLASKENAYRGLVYHTSAITGLQFHPEDSNTLLSGGRDGQVFVWSLEEKTRKKASGHLLGVRNVQWLKNGGFISFGNDMTLKTWAQE